MQEAKVLALIPAYNEGNRVGGVVTQTLHHLPVLVVDDGSRDETARLAKEAGAAVLVQTPNQGKGKALRLGFRHALEQGYDAVITLDADGQHDPDEVPLFLQRFQAQRSDLIIGKRHFDQMPPTRRIANTLGTWIFSWAVGVPIGDNQSGYRLLSRRLMEATLAGHEAGFEFEMEQILVCVEQGYALSWVPIRTIYEGERSHIRPFQHIWRFVRVSWQTRRRIRR